MCGIENESRPLGPFCLCDDAFPGLAPWAFESRRFAAEPHVARGWEVKVWQVKTP